MKKPNSYTGKDIQVLTDQQHVRLRNSIYFGSNELTEFTIPNFTNGKLEFTKVEFSPAVFRAYGEIWDNAIDEFTHLKNAKTKNLVVHYTKDLDMTISDNGRGVPIDNHASGKPTPEVVFTQLRSGRNFDDANKLSGVIGVNGVGSSCVAYCSNYFNVKILRDHKKYTQKYTDGALKITKPSIRELVSDKTGTEINFQLDKAVFGDKTNVPDVVIHNRMIELAAINTGISVNYNDHHYKFKKGFDELLSKSGVTDFFKFEKNIDDTEISVYLLFGDNSHIPQSNFTYVNGGLMLLGSSFETQFNNSLAEKVFDHLKSDAKKNHIEITKQDVFENIRIFMNIKIKNPQFDSQAKVRCIGPNLRKVFDDVVSDQWSALARKRKEWFTDILENAIARHSLSVKKSKLKEQKNASVRGIEELLDANSNVRTDCSLFIVEGLSARASLSEIRDPKTMGFYALTGKINNVYGLKPHQISQMGKLEDLFKVCGLVPGHKIDYDLLRYGKIIATSDADMDGLHITNLLVALYYTMWPEMFDPKNPMFYKLIVPSICVFNKSERHHFMTMTDFDKVKSKYKNYEIRYYKGLGSMVKADWKMILTNPDCFVPITKDENMDKTLELIFGNDADARKVWLQN